MLVEFDKKYLQKGYKIIAGCDEAGRGPLAGPVSIAACIMPLEQENIIQGINDSKKLSEKKRELLYNEILVRAIAYKIVLIDEKIIDKINILNATKKGMVEVINKLQVKPDIALIDAVKGLDLTCKQEGIIKGDAQSYNIACASILAKVYRDHYMQGLDKKYPEYQFAKHKGYGTKLHIELLKKYGPSKVHRKSFISNFVD